MKKHPTALAAEDDAKYETTGATRMALHEALSRSVSGWAEVVAYDRTARRTAARTHNVPATWMPFARRHDDDLVAQALEACKPWKGDA